MGHSAALSFFSSTWQALWRLSLLAVASLALACGQSQPTANDPAADPAPADGASAGRPRLAAVLMQEDQFYQLIQYGMQKAAAELGADLMIGNSFGALDKEISLVEAYVSRGIKALVVAPLSATASVPALERAHEGGLPIVTFDGMLDAEFPACNIQSDQVSLGATTARAARAYIEQKLGGQAKVAMIEYISLSPEIGGARVKGFKDEISQMPGVTIVAEQDAWMAPQAADVVESILSAHPDVNLIWAANEGGTVGAVTAVRNLNKTGQVVVFGTDISDQIADFLLADDAILQAVTGQKPYDIGYQAVASALKVLAGQPVERKVVLPGSLFSRDQPASVNEYRAFLGEVTAAVKSAGGQGQ